MFRRCKHQWRHVTTVFNPPTDREIRVSGPFDWERALYGITNITQACAECGLLRTHSVTGRVS